MSSLPEALRFYAQEMRDQERDVTADKLPTVADSVARTARESRARLTRRKTHD